MNGRKSDASQPWITVPRLRLVLAGSIVLGIVLPLVTVLLKLAAGEFQLWNEILGNHPSLRAFMAAYPILDVRSWPILEVLSWHHATDGGLFRLYFRVAAFNSCVLLALWIWRRSVSSLLRRAVEWVHRPEERYARRVIFVAVLIVVVTYPTRTSLGFWWPGIGGWTYANWTTQLSLPGATGTAVQEQKPKPPTYLRGAVVAEHAKYLPSGGRLSGSAMMLHFSNGKVLPGNYGLTGLVYPIYVFGQDYGKVSRPDVFFRLVQASLDGLRTGRSFLLPKWIALPNHMVHMNVDYTTYPPADQLEQISFWIVTLEIDGHRRTEVIDAQQTWTMENPTRGLAAR